MKRSKNTFIGLICAMLAGVALAAPDEDILGKANGYPTVSSRSGILEEGNKVGTITGVDAVYDTHKVPRSGPVRELRPMTNPPALRYYTFNKQPRTIEDFLNTTRTTGLLIMKGNEIITERYQYDRKPDMKFHGFSMTKTVVGILVGIALKDGSIKSLDDTVDTYVQELKGYDYGKVTIRNLLRMSSGMLWHETEGTGSDDVTWLGNATYKQKGSSGGMAFVKTVRASSDTPQGTKWSYNSCDTEVLGLVLRAATGKGLAEYASEKLWSKIGAESDASWAVDWSGMETGFAYFSATLRDWGRLGLFMADGLKYNGERIVPDEYWEEMTSSDAQPDYLKARSIYQYYGYGYQTWIMPYYIKTFQFVGSWGQRIVVQPDSKIVMVVMQATQTQNETVDQFKDNLSFWHGILKSLGGSTGMYPWIH
jgi:CubicO group peptidase (beta-lactamase class C family)